MHRSNRISTTLFVFLIFIIYCMGVVSTLAIPVDKVTNFKDALARKVGVIEKPSYPQIIDTSRYQFSLQSGDLIEGVFQLAEYDSSSFFAIERFSGQLFSFQITNQVFLKQYLGNIYDELGFLSNPKAATDGYAIDKAGNKLNPTTTIFATAFDIEYAFGRIYLSLTLPSEDQTCTFLSLYSFDVTNYKNVNIESADLIFKTPCVLDKMNPTMWGGRITHSKKSIFLSVGEQRFDPSGFPKIDIVSESEIRKKDSVFGKVLEFAPDKKEFRIFSSGHRNAQGLYFSDDDRKVWESEHGPFGGDEVNVLKFGGHFGWPFRTFGKPYGIDNGTIRDLSRSVNPSTSIDLELKKFGAKSGDHSDYLPPIISWTHSGSYGVGAGQLIKIQKKSNFKDWRGAILISHMRDFSLRRLVLLENSIVADERIQLGFRVRDFILNNLGYLIMSTDEGRLLIYKTNHSEFRNNL